MSTGTIIGLSICGILLLIWIVSIIYWVTDSGIFKIFYHNVLGWHKPDNKESFDGCSFHSHCKYCGKEIMQDSQGNWF